MSEPWWAALLREQQGSRFADLAGAEGTLTVPISDVLATRLAAMQVPSSVPLSEIDLLAEEGNRIAIRLRLSRPAFVPAITVRLAIVRQPALPHSPEIVFRIASRGLAMLAGAATRWAGALPPGVQVAGEWLRVDLRTLLERAGAADLLAYLTELQLTTVPGRFVVRARAAVPIR